MLRHQHQSGFSLLEVLIAGSLLSLMVYAVATLSVSGTEAQDFARRLNRVTEVTQDILDEMRLSSVSSVRLFGNNDEGNNNLALVDFGGAPARLPGSRLPAIASTGNIERDTVANGNTGNVLFYTRMVWSDRFVCSNGQDYMVDIYRWVIYYLTVEDVGPRAGTPVGLNLVRVTSEPLADGDAVNRIPTATERSQVLLHLMNGTADANGVTHAKVQVVWMRGDMPSVAGTFRQITPGTGVLSNSPISGTGRPATWSVLRDGSSVSGLLSYRHFSVATNYAPTSYGVGRFGVITAPVGTNLGFPHGFEVQMVGPSAARQVLLHLVVATTNRRGQIAWSDMQTIVGTRDL